MRSLSLLTAFWVAGSLLTSQLVWSANTPAVELPIPQRWLVPATFADGLTLLRVKNDCLHCPTQQELKFFGLEKPEPYRTEKIVLQSRFSAAYAYPGTHVFTMLSIEQSAAGQFANDAGYSKDAFIKECERQQFQLSQQGDAALAFYQAGLQGQSQLVTLQQQQFEQISLVRCDQQSLNLPDNVRSRWLWLDPVTGLRIRMNLTQQDAAPFKNIQQLNQLRNQVLLHYLQTLQQAQQQYTRYQRK